MKHTIDPRHEEPPHGDWPHMDIGPLDDLDKSASHDFAVLVLTALGVLGAGIILCGAVLLVWLSTMIVAWPRDLDGHWAQLSAEGKAPPKEWWNALASGKGLCCSFADGVSIKDVDWDTKDGHYRVRLDGEWIVVPDTALVTEPNKYGPAVVWPYLDADGATQIRCFMPGAGA